MNYKSLFFAMVFSTFSVSAFAEIVNINKADASAFQYYLSGIGEKRASKIVDYRQEHQEFKTIAEIMEVKGIGKGIFVKIKADLSLAEGEVSAPTKQMKTKKESTIIHVDTKKKKELKVLDKSIEVEPEVEPEVESEVSKPSDTPKAKKEVSSREKKLNLNKKENYELQVELDKSAVAS